MYYDDYKVFIEVNLSYFRGEFIDVDEVVFDVIVFVGIVD